MAVEDFINLANELKSAREENNISLQQMFQKSKIDIKFLQAIENGNFDILPEPYIRAFIKHYAQIVQLDPIAIIKKYDSIRKGKVPPTIIETSPKVENKLNKETDENINSGLDLNNTSSEDIPKTKVEVKYNIIAGSLILIAAVAILYFSLFYKSSSVIISDNSTNELENNEQQRFEVEKKDTIQVQTQKPDIISDSLTLSVHTSAPVWVKVLTDGKNIHQKMIEKDSKLNFKAKQQFSISIGNAGAVRLFFNNKEVQNVGKIGEIRNIVISPDTIRYLTIKRNDKKPN